MGDEDPYELGRIASWVACHEFRRVALQFPDHLLGDVLDTVVGLRNLLPAKTKVFVLGDSTHGSSSVDEVAAEHYGADCIVHIGPSDQQHAGTLPVLYVFGKALLSASAVAAKVAAELRRFERVDSCNSLDRSVSAISDEVPTSLVLVCDVALQHVAGRLAEAFGAALRDVHGFDGADVDAHVLVAVPKSESLASPSQPCGESNSIAPTESLTERRRDYRFGVLSVSSWWACGLGPLAIAAAAFPSPLRLCGREVQCWRRSQDEAFSPGNKTPQLGLLPDRCGLVLCTSAVDSALERRLLLRYGYSRSLWRLDPDSGELSRLCSNKLLLQRFRFVELAKCASVVGLVLAATGSRHTQAVAERLEEVLRRAHRQTYRFVVGRVTPEKLGNFPEVELFVSLASPEHFPWNSKEFLAPIASPYEVEVALGVREWTGNYITDPEELLSWPLPDVGLVGEDNDALLVQSLGSRGRVRNFARDNAVGCLGSAVPSVTGAFNERQAPALVTDGQHGVASQYNEEKGFVG
eukprot:TRINITY_DN54762_c0_g1_i1.p1 TRINITY_DN54762_c0_g1~~TRINITY_DN54762_c0_g1_i1.p1  ORF type:complete len:522 (-),score=89.15 TRINITY_DN54762_c0_g1_i1:326-1891(-)